MLVTLWREVTQYGGVSYSVCGFVSLWDLCSYSVWGLVNLLGFSCSVWGSVTLWGLVTFYKGVSYSVWMCWLLGEGDNVEGLVRQVNVLSQVYLL